MKFFGGSKKDKKKEPTGVITVSTGKVNQDDFEVQRMLGKGAFGRVALVTKKDTGDAYAMKVINKESLLDKGRVQDLFSERSVMRRAKHPFITQLHYAFQSPHKLYFVMEYMPHGDLDTYLKTVPQSRLSERAAKFYAAEIYTALHYLHENDIIYRDLKPENILMDRAGHACLADFGLARDFQLDPSDTERTQSFVGSPYYVAPDVLRKKGYGKAVDWWSYGVLVFRMVTGTVPFTGRNVRDLFQSIVKTDVNMDKFTWVSPEAKNLCLGLLQKDENMRFGDEQIRKHPWFSGIDFDGLLKKDQTPPDWVAPKPKPITANPQGTEVQQLDELASSPPTDIPSAQQALFDGFTYANTPGLAQTGDGNLLSGGVDNLAL